MPVGRHEVDPEVMAQAATNVGGVVQNLSGTATTMTNQLVAMAPGWVGAGGTAFQNAHPRIRTDLDLIMNALDQLMVLVNFATTNYVNTDTDAGSTVEAAAGNAGTIATQLKF